MSSNVKWVRSSACNADACVEVAAIGDKMEIRDSKSGDKVAIYDDEYAQLLSEITDPAIAPLVWRWLASEGLHFDDAEKAAFVDGVRGREFEIARLVSS